MGQGGASARTGEPGRPRRSLSRAGNRASRPRPACGAWAAEELPGRAWAPAAGMSLTGRRGRRGRRVLPRSPAWLRPRPAPSGCGRWGGGFLVRIVSPTPLSAERAPPTAPNPFPQWGATCAAPFLTSPPAMPALEGEKSGSKGLFDLNFILCGGSWPSLDGEVRDRPSPFLICNKHIFLTQL